MSEHDAVPPGWYPDQAGAVRWWDGARWTEHVAPAADGSRTEGSPVRGEREFARDAEREAKKEAKAAARQERRAARAERAELHRLDTAFEGWRIAGDKLLCTKLKHPGTWDVAGASAQALSGAGDKRANLLGAAVGGLVFGGAGAVVGAMGGVDATKCYLVVTCPDGSSHTDEFPIKEQRRVIEFANRLNAAAAHFAGKAPD